MSEIINNLQSIYNTKLQIKNVIGTTSDVFADYPSLIEAAISGGVDLEYIPEEDYLTFTNESENTTIGITIQVSVSNLGRTLYYKKSSQSEYTRIDIDPNAQMPTISLEPGESVKWYGENDGIGLGDEMYGGHVSFVNTSYSTDLWVDGNINSLHSRIAYDFVPAYCFVELFQGFTCTFGNIELPATKLGQCCYSHMFEGNHRFDNGVPELPATILANDCYISMFADNGSLTTAPALPATTLAKECYLNMFWGCSNLTAAPALPATTLKEGCYQNMFHDCTSLTAAAVMAPTVVAENCCNGMYNGCTSLITAPNTLPAMTLTNSCYKEMFKGCAALTTVISLPATTLAAACYSSMFEGCTSLTAAPSLAATTLAESCYNRMFYGCTSLDIAPSLAATTLPAYCYQNMFYGCSMLNCIQCLATTLGYMSVWNWLYGVASTGTFVKDATMTGWPTGDSGIPSGWTVQDAA